MKTVFDSLFVNYAEYSYFKQLPVNERIDYLFNLYQVGVAHATGIDLSKFFDTINNSIEPETQQPSVSEPGLDQVDVIIDDHHIMVESNSLKALRYIVYKFAESGYILKRDLQLEKMFRRDKITKYLRIFEIVDQTSSICTN